MSQSQRPQLYYSLKPVIILAVLLIASGKIFGQTSSFVSATKPAETVNSAVSANETPKITEGKVIKRGEFDIKTDVKKTSDTEFADRLNALEESIRAQNAKIEKMNEVIAGQQRVIQQLSGKLNVPNTSASSESAAASNLPPSNVSDTKAVENSQPQTIDGRVKKIEDQVLKIGAVRLNGDFRLRFDAAFRGSQPQPPTGFQTLSIVQNVRPTYRLRLNMDADVGKVFSFHGQLATGPVNDPLSNEQDFSATVARQPFFINEAWIDYHPNKSIQLQGGRLQEIFADNSRFLFDDDVRFNGFNEKYTLNLKKSLAGFTNVEFRAGQYIFSNPNIAVITSGSPLAQAGAIVGSIGRASNLFHQGILANHEINKKYSQQFGADLQIYRNPNQIQLASTATGAVLIVYPGLGITLSGPLAGTGNATTTAGGAIYSARNFEIARLTYRLNYAGFKYGEHVYPITFNIQAARNVGTGQRERDAFLAALQIGKVVKRNDMAFTYILGVKGANSMISQLTDNNLGTGTGVNIRTNHFRFDYGISKRITFQSLFYIQNELRSSGDFPNFFVPLNAFTPRLYRFQEQMVFTF